MTVVINLENLLPNSSSDLPKKLCRNSKNVSSIWSCSRWGLPCRLHCWKRGVLLPHLFTLTKIGGIFSVALSLGLPLLDVIQHLISIEPGLSSLKKATTLLSDKIKI